MNFTSFGKRVLADVTKLRIWKRSSWIDYKVGPYCHCKYFYKREGERQTEEKEALAPQRQRLEWCGHKSRNAWNQQNLEERKNRFSSRASRGNVAIHTLISGFWDHSFLFFEATQLVGICYSSQKKLMHSLHQCPTSSYSYFPPFKRVYVSTTHTTHMYYKKFFSACMCVNSSWHSTVLKILWANLWRWTEFISLVHLGLNALLWSLPGPKLATWVSI